MATAPEQPDTVDTDLFFHDVAFQVREAVRILNEKGYRAELEVKAPKYQGVPGNYSLESEGNIWVVNNKTGAKELITLKLNEKTRFAYGPEMLEASGLTLIHQTVWQGVFGDKFDWGGFGLTFRVHRPIDSTTWVARDLHNNEINFNTAINYLVLAIADAPDPRLATTFVGLKSTPQYKPS